MQHEKSTYYYNKQDKLENTSKPCFKFMTYIKFEL